MIVAGHIMCYPLVQCRLLLVCLLASACVPRSVASDYPREPTYALTDTQDTPLGHTIVSAAKGHPGMSGYYLITTGSDAFAKRVALIRSARRSLDMQYYIIRGDATGSILLQEVLFAADRGVRVRMLVDDMYTDAIDDNLSVFNAHPNIEIRSFNPRSTKGSPPFARIYNYLFDWDRVTRRMHNKALIADNQAAIVGGRNLGDEYFNASHNFNFNDIDMIAGGPVVRSISHSFDQYWNSESAFPLRALKVPQATKELAHKVRTEMQMNRDKFMKTEEAQTLREPSLHEALKRNNTKLLWAKGSLSVDDPRKLDAEPDEARSKPAERIDSLLDNAKSEFIIISAYFVPRDEGVEWLHSLTKRGLRVRVLTNSLASTDVAAVHAGYARYRKALLEGGVELYEFKPQGSRPKQKFRGSTSPASLHAKVYVIDRKHVVLGSFNLDPRSIELNTELAITIHSEILAGQILNMFNKSTQPSECYHVVLSDDSRREGVASHSTSLRWITQEEDGRMVTYDHEPAAGIVSHAVAGITSLLPVEDQL